MIREAELTDVDQLMRLSREFYRCGGFRDKGMSFNEKTFKNFLAGLISGEFGIILIAEQNSEITGMIAAFVNPCMLDDAQAIVTELFWWVSPAHRGRIGLKLLKALEKSAEKIDAKFIIMASLANGKENIFKKYYKKTGYKLLEYHYIKELRK